MSSSNQRSVLDSTVTDGTAAMRTLTAEICQITHYCSTIGQFICSFHFCRFEHAFSV